MSMENILLCVGEAGSKYKQNQNINMVAFEC